MLTALENQVLDMLLNGELEGLRILREQLKVAKVLSREMTGVGFFIEFEIPPEVRRLSQRQPFELGDVDGNASNLEHGVGFVLFVKDGQLRMLEGYTYDEPWPSELKDVSLNYRHGQRDPAEVSRIVAGRKK